MAELLTCRRLTEPVGGNTAGEAMADTNLPDRPVYPQTAFPVVEAQLVGFSDDAGSVLPEAERGGAATCRPPILDPLPFTEIWAVDFEFGAKAGENPEPVCLVAWELRSGRKLRLWRDEFGSAPPYPTGPDVLFVAYYASAEIGCHLALGWPVPRACVGPVHRVPQSNERHSHGQRRRIARRTCPLSAWTASAPSRKTKCAT